MKSRKKKQYKNNKNYEPVEQTHYCVKVFTDYHMKRALSLCVILKSTSKCTLCNKRIMLSL